MVLTIGAKIGPLRARIGRNAISSIRMPSTAVPRSAPTRAATGPARVHSTICSPISAPIMKTSPWARCTSPSTPKISA